MPCARPTTDYAPVHSFAEPLNLTLSPPIIACNHPSPKSVPNSPLTQHHASVLRPMPCTLAVCHDTSGPATTTARSWLCHLHRYSSSCLLNHLSLSNSTMQAIYHVSNRRHCPTPLDPTGPLLCLIHPPPQIQENAMSGSPWGLPSPPRPAMSRV